MSNASRTNTASQAFVVAARRLYRKRRSTVAASLNADTTCTCDWCRAVRAFLKAGSADYQARRYK